jgi:DNA repair protein SbcC/Rad50
MHITKVELENIKSHFKSTFEFSRGTTAITGRNGAGKSTIIESIAWALFDVLDYKKDDFLRRGSKKGWARVSFVSSVDDREYTVVRDTGTSYYITDPRLEMRVADKKEDVSRFLWKHLGIEPGTDLVTLFRHAIGVPQGTLTAIFLATPAERKKTFDQLLKVEEYRRSSEELLKTQRFIENLRNEQEHAAARLEGELKNRDQVRKDRERLSDEIAELTASLESAIVRAAELAAAESQSEAAEKRLRAASEQAEKRRNEADKAALLLKQKETAHSESKQAAEKVAELKPHADEYEDAERRLKELERERKVRDGLLSQMQSLESAEASVRVDQKHTKEKIEELHKIHSELAGLRAGAEKQSELEAALRVVADRAAAARASARQAEDLKVRLQSLRKKYSDQRAELNRYEAMPALSLTSNDLDTQHSAVVSQLARFRAELERDEKLRIELKDGMCPILSERCLNLKEGQTLEGFLTGRFDDLRQKIADSENEKKRVKAELEAAKEAERHVEKAAILKAQFLETEEEGTRLKAEEERIKKEVDALSLAEAELATIEKNLAALNNPKGRLEIAETQLRAEPDLLRRLTEVESNLERLESERRILVEQLEDHKDLDASMTATLEKRDELGSKYREFIANEPVAKRLAEIEDELKRAAGEKSMAAAEFIKAKEELEAAEREHDAQRYKELKAELSKAREEQTELRVRVETKQRQLEEVEKEIKRLDGLQEQLETLRSEAEKQQKLLAATIFIRDTLKEAAPLVAQNYVFHVSAEANLMFREISGDGERTLRWAEDYGIFLEENGFERPFQSLSGGEQTAAAMAVRLALLKQLSDIRIAFFDEPTANMDAERRENLAIQVGQISDFEQLFVISHDDTFEGYLDHEIRIG